MDFFNKYDLRFVGLKAGKHYFSYEVNPEFFGLYEDSLIEKASASIKVELDKQNDKLYLINLNIEGVLGLECDRCLNEFDLKIQSKHTLIMKAETNNDVVDDEDVIFVTEDQNKINIADYIYEFMMLHLPMRKECEMGGVKCNSEMVKKIEKINFQSNDKNEIDPIWEELRKLSK